MVGPTVCSVMFADIWNAVVRLGSLARAGCESTIFCLGDGGYTGPENSVAGILRLSLESLIGAKCLMVVSRTNRTLIGHDRPEG